MNIPDYTNQLGKQARNASRQLTNITTREKNHALQEMANSLRAHVNQIKKANEKDLQLAEAAQLSSAMCDRLLLNEQRIEQMAKGIEHIISLPDPVGISLNEITRPNGLKICKVRVPIGVIGVIYESRPNVTADVAALCLKTSNAVILRGGTEAIHSNTAILQALMAGLEHTKIPITAIQLVTNPDHEVVRALVQMEKYIDLIIPRGGEKLIRTVNENARVPVIKHYKGVCHTFIDESADLTMALQICENAKCQKPGVCNAMETLLVHQQIAPIFLPALVEQLAKYSVEFRGDSNARKIIPSMQIATEEDWDAEYLDFILAVKIIPDIETAIEHINFYGTHHSDAIVTNSKIAEEKFMQEIDSAVVYVNASTRFTDGGEFGMGAEIGISTDKLHARGPMGLEELTTYKYKVIGSGQIRG